jgi:hypothetical protein
MLQVKVNGVPELMAQLSEFSSRRFNAMIATALTRTAVGVRDDMRASAQQAFDRPRPYTVNAIRHVGATAETLRAVVEVRPDSSAATYLQPQVFGGPRPQKRFEQLAGAMGLPSGWVVVPGPAAKIDSFGNMERRQLREVLAQVSAPGATGRSRGKRAASRMRYFVINEGRNAAPGVYVRAAGSSRSIAPVLLFVSSATYAQRWRFHDEAAKSAQERLPAEMRRAVDEAIARFLARR